VNDLLRLALDAHGGLDRWREVHTLTVHARIGGELWGRRGQQGILNDAYLEIDPHHQHLIFHHFTAPDRRGVFDAERTALETDTDEILQKRADPAAAFAGQTPTTPWDDLDVAYTAGFSLWGFFTAPFSLAMPGVHSEEIGPWEEAGAPWRRLRVTFPDGFIAHAPEQTYAFDSSGLLRRYDYQSKLPGVPANVNYVTEHKSYGGLILPTRRRMLPASQDGRASAQPVLMSIDVLNVRID